MSKPKENFWVHGEETRPRINLRPPGDDQPFTDDELQQPPQTAVGEIRRGVEYEPPIARVAPPRRPRNWWAMALALIGLYLSVAALVGGVEYFYFDVYPYPAFGMVVAFLVVVAGKTFADMAREERDDQRDKRREAVGAEYPAFFRVARSRAVIAVFEEMT